MNMEQMTVEELAEMAAEEEISRVNMMFLYETLCEMPGHPVYMGDGMWLYADGHCDFEDGRE